MKLHRIKMRECEANGNLIEADISVYGVYPEIALICLKHKCACHSKACKEEREKED